MPEKLRKPPRLSSLEVGHEMWGALSSTEEGLFRGEGLWRKAHPQDRSLFLKIGKLSESSEGTISKGKVVTTSSILGHYPYTLSQTLAEQQGSRDRGGAPSLRMLLSLPWFRDMKLIIEPHQREVFLTLPVAFLKDLYS